MFLALEDGIKISPNLKIVVMCNQAYFQLIWPKILKIKNFLQIFSIFWRFSQKMAVKNSL